MGGALHEGPTHEGVEQVLHQLPRVRVPGQGRSKGSKSSKGDQGTSGQAENAGMQSTPRGKKHKGPRDDPSLPPTIQQHLAKYISRK